MADPFELRRFNLDLSFPFKKKYENYIGGKWVAPSAGRYFENVSPITGKAFTSVAQSDAEDVERALDAAHAAQAKWGRTSVTERSGVLLKIADRMEQNLQMLAVAESIDNGKPLRESLGGDLPMAIDHFRYFAGCLRAQEGTLSDIDENIVAYHFQEPIGVVGQIIPWNFPLVMAAWKLAPALAAGCAVVLKPAEQTPASILVLMETIGDLVPPGVINIVNGMGKEAGEALATSKRIAKIAFTGSTATGQRILHAAADNLIPSTVELGGKSPNIFFADVMDKDDGYLDKALEGLAMFSLNSGEVCTCPSRILVQESIAEQFIEKARARVAQIKAGHPLDMETMIGAQVSQPQLEKILGYLDIGRQEGASALIGGERNVLGDGLEGGYYVKPTILQGNNKMRVFQEEIFGPVAALTTFRDMDEAIEIANDSPYGLAAGVWTRNGTLAYKAGRAIQAGRVWTNCFNDCPAHAAFGGYKHSGIGRETHKMALGNYQQIKCLMVNYAGEKMGLF